MTTFTDLTTFTVVTCYKCFVPFGMATDMQKRLVDNGHSFYCPNGHGQCYTESTVQKLEKQLKRKQSDIEYFTKRNNELYNQKAAVERRLSAKKGQITKIKNRIAQGVCPCCHRSFEDLKRHMKSQHPEFASGTTED